MLDHSRSYFCENNFIMPLIHYHKCPICSSLNIVEVFWVKDFAVSGEKFQIWECCNCGLRFTQDVPDELSILPYYLSDSYISHSETKQGLINKLYHPARILMLHQKLKKITLTTGLKSGKILDIGSGTGTFLHFLREKGWEVTGIEPDPGARKLARDLYHLELLNFDNIFKMPDQNFQLITLWHVLEHVHSLHALVSQIKRLLLPEGFLFIAVPNYHSKDATKYQEYWAAYDVPRHLYHFDQTSMESLMIPHGFIPYKKFSLTMDPFYICWLSENYRTGKNRIFAGILNGANSYFEARNNLSKSSSILFVWRVEPS